MLITRPRGKSLHLAAMTKQLEFSPSTKATAGEYI